MGGIIVCGGILFSCPCLLGGQWLSGRMFDSRPRVRASPESLRCVLEQDINPCLVLVQPRKICPFITERLLMGRKESNQMSLPLSVRP